MTEMDRKVALDSLADQWGTYVTTYQRMSPEEQAEFMQRQGYARFADLVAHFTAWWELAMQVNEVKQHDPSYFFPDINVDEFNANAVEKAKNLSEDQVLEQFEETRLKFIDCVNQLSDEDLLNPNIIRQLEIDLVGHLAEHALNK